jgi:hypothetical protein
MVHSGTGKRKIVRAKAVFDKFSLTELTLKKTDSPTPFLETRWGMPCIFMGVSEVLRNRKISILKEAVRFSLIDTILFRQITN